MSQEFHTTTYFSNQMITKPVKNGLWSRTICNPIGMKRHDTYARNVGTSRNSVVNAGFSLIEVAQDAEKEDGTN